MWMLCLWLWNEPTLGKQLDAYVRDYVAANQFQGVVLVADKGEILLHQAYGQADREAGKSNTPDTPFLVGSFTKSVTAIATLRLVEQGRIALDEPIATYLPELKGKAAGDVSVHHLLKMQSGLSGHVRRLVGWERAMSAEGLVDAISVVRPDYRPGSSYNYSNLNYHLLAAAVERVGGRPFGEVVRREIFEPAGMRRSVAGGTMPKDVALGYDVSRSGRYSKARRHQLSMALGSGDVAATSGDLFKLDRALHEGRLLSEAMTAKMFDGASEARGWYGYGWRIMPYKRAEGKPPGRLARHGGSMWGYLANVHRYLDDDFTIIILANQRPCPIRNMHRGLKAILIGEPVSFGDAVTVE